MPTHVPARAAVAPVGLVLVLTLLLGIQPITTDLYLPALPTLQRDLGAGLASTQSTLSVLIVCFGIGQLFCGPLADRHGRKPVLLGGLAVYVVASIGSATAGSIGTLIAWRALQGLAMAAPVACARAIVRDLYLPHDGARVLSRALTGLGLIAVASPVLGGLLVQAIGWPATLVATAAFGTLAWTVVALRLDETLPRPDRDATRPSRIAGNARQVIANRTFRAWTALVCCSYGGLFFLLAGSSFVFIDVLGTTRLEYGAILASCSVAYVAGTWLCRRLLVRHGLAGAVRRGAWLSLAGGVSMAALALAGVHAVWALVVPQWLYAIGHGVHQPCGQAGAVGPFPDKAGTAAALSGFAMMATAFVVGQTVGHVAGGSVLPMALGIGTASVLVATVGWTLIQRDGESRPQAVVAAAMAVTR
jgi:MFS transporter, DHA1 family, multidrug resistance protein